MERTSNDEVYKSGSAAAAVHLYTRCLCRMQLCCALQYEIVSSIKELIQLPRFEPDVLPDVLHMYLEMHAHVKEAKVMSSIR